MKKKSLLLTALATLGLTAATMAQVPNYVPTNGLVGWWPFNGNANDESGNGNNGTVNGATLTQDRFGNGNSAYYFSGAGCATRIDASVNTSSVQSALTFSYWFLQSGNGCVAPRTFEFGTGSPVSGFLQCQNWNTYNSLWFITGSNQGVTLTCTSTPINQWANITFSINNTIAKLYYNGALADSQIVNSGNINLNSIMCVGRMNHPAYDAHEGNIDDIGIWNRALTQQEITNLYNSVNCSNNTAITPQTNLQVTGGTATFNASTTDSNPSYIWQSDFGQGYVTLNNFGNYSGANTSTLNIANVQFANHNQPIRVITTSGNCIDTSSVAFINIADTCITNVTVYDTLLTTVTDTLIINTQITGINPPNNSNTIKVFPNPASTHITIDYGNFAIMNGYLLKIENSIGQQVFQTNITQQSDYLSLNTWGGNGLYFVHIIDPQGNTIDIRKIVLQ